jgi:hypothetical protein
MYGPLGPAHLEFWPIIAHRRGRSGHGEGSTSMWVISRIINSTYIMRCEMGPISETCFALSAPCAIMSSPLPLTFKIHHTKQSQSLASGRQMLPPTIETASAALSISEELCHSQLPCSSSSNNSLSTSSFSGMYKQSWPSWPLLVLTN